MRWIAWAVAAGMALGVGYWGWQRRGGSEERYEAWPPTVQQIAQAIEALGPAAPEQERWRLFERLFTSRFRRHTMAVRLRWRAEREADLLCAAAIGKASMARMAHLAYTDAYLALGYPVRVHIYETYILAPRRRVGILEPAAAGARPTVRFDPYAMAEGPWRLRLQRDGVLPPDDPSEYGPATRSAGSPEARSSR